MYSVVIDGVPVDVNFGTEAEEYESQGVGDMATEDLMTGVVRSWHEDRGFGFITPDGGKDDVFVHRSVLRDGESLVEGCPVMFDLTYDTERKGFKATKCLGAVAALISLEDALAEAEGRPVARKKGKGGSKGWGDPLYRASFVDDPWTALYAVEGVGPHLRAHLDGEAGSPEEGAVARGRRKTLERRDKDAADKAASDAAEKAASGVTFDVPSKAAKAPAAAQAEPEAKATSIYDFFGGDEDAVY